MAKVLLIDDEEMIRRIFPEFLKSELNLKVITAKNGKQGLDFLVAEKPDLILCDFNMPEMNGYEFCREINENPMYSEFRSIPIVGIGSFPEEKREYLKECHEKPFTSDESVGFVKKYIK